MKIRNGTKYNLLIENYVTMLLQLFLTIVRANFLMRMQKSGQFLSWSNYSKKNKIQGHNITLRPSFQQVIPLQ